MFFSFIFCRTPGSLGCLVIVLLGFWDTLAFIWHPFGSCFAFVVFWGGSYLWFLGCLVVVLLGSWFLDLLGCIVAGLLDCWVVWLSLGCCVVGIWGCWVVVWFGK